VALIASFFLIDGPQTELKQEVIDISIFVVYWVGLGIASSIGLGTGLHTLILYLGPFIAQVTLAANKCNKVPIPLPSRWRFQNFEQCE
jgi:hypothetical protein